MRPSYSVPDIGTFREITLWKAIVLGILTLGIYLYVVTYQHTRDIQQARAQPFDAWLMVFWIGVIPFLGILHFVLYVFNGLGYKEFMESQGKKDDSLWIVSLVLAIVLPPVGQILWAVTFNNWIRSAGSKVEETVVLQSASATQ